ncbi:unnamed protein product [Scytosiphon promiscuus]
MSSGLLSCVSDFPVAGLQRGEDYLTPIRIFSTFCAATVTASWFNRTKISRLRLFFAHWLSGLVMGIGYVVEDMMVTVCWTGSNLMGLIKAIKFIELAAGNMLAITNLAICVNLALVIMSHRTATRVKSMSTPIHLLLFLVLSVGIAAITVPFWEQAIVLATGFWFGNSDKAENTFITVSVFYVEFAVGVSMLAIVVWQLLFRRKEIRECWKIHVRIRYYFGLTLLGTVVNLALGICGSIHVSQDNPDSRLLIWSWLFRYIHISLDTVVLYGVLGEGKKMDERSGRADSSNDAPSGDAKSRGTARVTDGRHQAEKPVAMSLVL